jgi:hypothetical protein
MIYSWSALMGCSYNLFTNIIGSVHNGVVHKELYFAHMEDVADGYERLHCRLLIANSSRSQECSGENSWYRDGMGRCHKFFSHIGVS